MTCLSVFRWPSGGGATQLFVLCHVFERTITCSTASGLSSNSKGHGEKSSGENVDDFAYKLDEPFYLIVYCFAGIGLSLTLQDSLHYFIFSPWFYLYIYFCMRISVQACGQV